MNVCTLLSVVCSSVVVLTKWMELIYIDKMITLDEEFQEELCQLTFELLADLFVRVNPTLCFNDTFMIRHEDGRL